MQRYDKYKTNSKGALCLVSTFVSGWASAFGGPYGPWPKADTQPDTRVDTQPRTPFSVGLIYVLPTGGEETHILGVGNIPAAILSSCQDLINFAIELHKNVYNWIVKIRNTSEAVPRPQYTYGPWSVWWPRGVLWPLYCLLYVSYINILPFFVHQPIL